MVLSKEDKLRRLEIQRADYDSWYNRRMEQIKSRAENLIRKANKDMEFDLHWAKIEYDYKVNQVDKKIKVMNEK